MLTAHDRLIARQTNIRPSLRRAPARNAEVRLNSNSDHGDARQKIQNWPAFPPGTGVRASRTVAYRPCGTLQPSTAH